MKSRLWLLLIIAGAAIFRFYKINSPILDLYPVRQEMCAMIARNFLSNGFNFFRPQLDWFGSQDSVWSMELPLISYLTALLYKFFGVRELLGRVVAVIFSLGSIVLYYKFLRLFFKEKVALLAAFFFSFTPLNVYFSRTFMPESLMLFFCVGMYYYFCLWLKNDRLHTLLLSSIFAALALLSKPFTVFLWPSMLYLLIIKYGKRVFFSYRIWILLAISFLPAVFWYMRSELSLYKHLEPFWPILASHKFYERIFISFSLFLTTPVGLPLLFLGLILKNHSKEDYFFHICFVSLIGFLFVNAFRNLGHYYYQLPFVIVTSIFMAKGLEYLGNRNFYQESIFSRAGDNYAGIISIVILALFLAGILSIRPFYNWNKNTYLASKFLDRTLPRHALLIAGRCTQEAPLYYTNRKGWVMNEAGEISYLEGYFYADENKRIPRFNNEIERIEYLISKGANYYFSVNVPVWESNLELVNYLKDNFKVIVDNRNLVLFDLKR
jgi:4-amino-4-deoxy-L-arabinose transferase-like glycosyltransferase